MSDRGLPKVVIRVGAEPETIRFYSSRFDCYPVHWIDERQHHYDRNKIKQVPCEGINCRLCLSGNAPSIRFGAVVKHNGEQKEIEFSRNGYLVFYEFMETFGRNEFRKTDFRVSREPTSGGFAEYVIEAVT